MLLEHLPLSMCKETKAPAARVSSHACSHAMLHWYHGIMYIWKGIKEGVWGILLKRNANRTATVV